MKPRPHGLNFPSILDAISRDAIIYFAFISAAHCAVVIVYCAARVRFFSLALVFSSSLTDRSALLANVTSRSSSVSRPNARTEHSNNVVSLLTTLPFYRL